MEGKDNIDNTSRISRPRHDPVTATLTGDAQRKPAQSRTQVQDSTRLREEPLTSVQGEIMGSGRDVQNRDERAIAKEDDVPKEQETSKNVGGAKAQRIMDELNDSARMAKKIAELQQPKLQQKKSQQQKLKQQVSNIGKHLEEQRALEVQLENRNAEIDRLRVDLSVERTHSQEKDAEINQLRDSLERLRQDAGKNPRDASLENPVIREDFNLNTDQEKRGNGCLLSSLYHLISLIVDEPLAPDDSLSPPIFTERKARLGNMVSKSPGQFIFASTAAMFIAFFFFYIIS
jgi:hypothetical protein